MSLVSDIETLLIAGGVSNIYLGNQPTTPDATVTVAATGGYNRSLSGSYLEEPTFQIRVRSASYAAGVTVCETVKDTLHGASTDKLLIIQQMGDVQDLGRDENGRPEWTLNFRTYYKRS